MAQTTYDQNEVSNPRFQPRWYSLEPRVFGRARHVGWKDAYGDQQRRQLLASQIQHDYAVAIRDAISASAVLGSVRDYAIKAGADYQRLAKVLRGEAIMRFEDVADAHRVLGLPLPNARPEEGNAKAVSS